MSSINPQIYILKNNKKLVLRTAMVKDASQVIKIMKSVIAEGPYTLAEPGEYKATIKSERARIRRFAEDKGKIFLVAEVNKQAAGFISFDNWDTRRTRHTGLFSVFVGKKWRGLGAGRILVNGMLQWAEANPLIRKISLYVFSTNKPAITLYKKLGFQVEGRFKNDMIINGKYVHSIAMCKFVKTL